MADVQAAGGTIAGQYDGLCISLSGWGGPGGDTGMKTMTASAVTVFLGKFT